MHISIEDVPWFALMFTSFFLGAMILEIMLNTFPRVSGLIVIFGAFFPPTRYFEDAALIANHEVQKALAAELTNHVWAVESFDRVARQKEKMSDVLVSHCQRLTQHICCILVAGRGAKPRRGTTWPINPRL
ncbi:hypothetical protein L218DRAFT_948059 [Marasmius fiardii PR-910]|nr:hypothetical protein L218DRAFT_948059 [Marasmius fiardii PR-910]